MSSSRLGHLRVGNYRVVFLCSILVIAALCGAQPQDQKLVSSDSLIGLWVSEQVTGPKVQGELTLEARGSEWRAKIAGLESPVEHKNSVVTFVLPGGAGEFRGHFSPDAKSITGHWIQPASDVYNNRYATPVRFLKTGAGRWTGDVDPLQERLSFYLAIRAAQDSSITAVVRNPEFNYLGRRVYAVELKNGQVTFSNTKDPSNQLQGKYDEKTDRLSIFFPDFSRRFEFVRRKNNDTGYFPRVPRGAAFEYKRPAEENDGWSTASLTDVGLDARPIASLIEKILGADPLNNSVNIHSLLIARHGKLVLEECFYGFDRERPHDMRSASKTFAPALVGIARDHGAKIAPETLIYPLFAEYRSFANWSDRKSKLTLGHLMTMTSGYACDDNDDSSPGEENHMQQQTEQPDWYKYALDLPMLSDSGGEHAIYCSADINLVGGALRNATQVWLPEFFDEYFARPLRFHSYHLNLMPTGEAYMGGGAYVRPRDQLKLGQLYLSGGLWNGRRVVSKEWVEQSIAHHSSFTPAMEIEGEHQYGYGWHIHYLKSGGKVYRDYAAGGNGGQVVVVIPELDMVVGFNGGSYGEFPKWYRWELDLLPQYIIPSALTEKER
jgi:CubicO group peptidase (beta-lactamase class C family)